MPRCWLVKATSASASTSAGAGASDDAYETGLTAGKTESLSAKKPPKEWEPGDRVFLWFRRRVVALAQITSIAGGDFVIEHLTGLLAAPIGIDDLREDVLIGDAVFLRQGVTGSVFALDERSARRLGRLVGRRQPTRSEVLDAWFGTEAMRHKADLLDLRRPYVLIASPDPTVRAKLYEWAADHWRDQVDLDEVEDGAQLMEMAEERAPAAVIVAFFLAELSGMEVARRLREDPRFSATRIALLMPEGDDDLLGETPHDAVVRMPLRRAEVTERVGPLIALEIADV